MDFRSRGGLGRRASNAVYGKDSRWWTWTWCRRGRRKLGRIRMLRGFSRHTTTWPRDPAASVGPKLAREKQRERWRWTRSSTAKGIFVRRIVSRSRKGRMTLVMQMCQEKVGGKDGFGLYRPQAAEQRQRNVGTRCKQVIEGSGRGIGRDGWVGNGNMDWGGCAGGGGAAADG